jgi:hypothetical protein
VEFLCGLIVVLGVIAVVGHGIWVLMAALLRAVSDGAGQGHDRPRRPPKGNPCPGCGEWLPPWEPECPACGLRRGSAAADELRELDATSRHLQRFKEAGAVDEVAWEKLCQCLEARRRELSPVRPPPVPPREAPPPVLEPVEAIPYPAPAEPEPVAAPPAAVPAPVPAPPPRPPRRSLSDVLAAFMEERNILWGELVGGLLIVGCSIALVITLWQSLEAIPYFPFLAFAAVTGGLFAGGEYTLHHWKLASTSRGLLIISLLLVPLNLLVLADPSVGSAGGLIDPAVRLAALAAFAWLIRVAGCDLIGTNVLPGPIDRRWLLTLAVLGAAGSQLFIPRQPDAQDPGLFTLLACLPVACNAIAVGAVVAGLWRWLSRNDVPLAGDEALTPASALFVFLGVATFALGVALAFLLARTGDLAAALPRLAVPMAVAGAPVLAAGLLVRQRLARDNGAVRTAGTGVALAGVVVMLAAVPLAWTLPLPLVLVCALDGAVFTWVALCCGLPWAQAAALPCLGLGYLTLVHLVTGRLTLNGGESLADLLGSAASSRALVAFAAALLAVSEVFGRGDRSVPAMQYAAGAAVAAVCSLGLVTWHGTVQPATAGVVYALCGVGALVANARWRRPALPHIGLGLLMAGSLWLLQWGWPAERPWWGPVVAAESLILACIAGCRGRLVRLREVTAACGNLSAVAGVIAVGLALFAPGFPVSPAHTITAAVLAAAALMLAGGQREPTLTWVASALTFAAFAHGLAWDLGEARLRLPLVAALLGHATLTLAAGLAVMRGRVEATVGPLAGGERVNETVFGEPLYRSAQVTSVFAVLPLVFQPEPPLVPAVYAAWLGAVWLILAWAERSAAWFTGFQAAVSAAVLLAVSAWLDSQPWLADSPFGRTDPRALQAYGLGLGLLGLAWVAARALARGRATSRWWDAVFPGFDDVVLGVLVVGQLGLAVWGVAPGVDAELGLRQFGIGVSAPEHVHAYGAGAWCLLAVVATVLVATGWQRGRTFGTPYLTGPVLGLVAAALTAAVLGAGPFTTDRAALSALRWTLAACFLVCSVTLWQRSRLASLPRAVGLPAADVPMLPSLARLLLNVAGGVVVAFTLMTAIPSLNGVPLGGPATDSIFGRMGWSRATVTPLLFLMIGLVGHAVRERLEGYAFAGGLTANLAASLTVAQIWRGAGLDDRLTTLLQANVITAALVALAWQGMWRLRRDRPTSGLLAFQSLFGLGMNTIWLLGPLQQVFEAPQIPHPGLALKGQGSGWLALVLAAAAALGYFDRAAPRGRGHVLGVTGLSAGVLAACFVVPWDTGNWLSFHALLGAWCLIGLYGVIAGTAAFAVRLAEAAGDEPGPLATRFAGLLPAHQLRRWMEGLGLAIFLLALRGAWSGPYRPYVPAGTLLVVAVMAAGLAIWFRQAFHALAAGLLFNATGVVLWLEWGPGTFVSFLWANALGLALSAVLGMALDRTLAWATRRDPEDRPLPPPVQPSPFAAYRRFATALALGLAVVVVTMGLASDVLGGSAATADDVLGGPVRAADGLGWAALVAVALALGTSLWDPQVRFVLPGLYVWGLVAIGLSLHALRQGPGVLGRTASLALAAYVLVTTLVQRWRGAVALELTRERRDKGEWFLPAQSIVSALVLLLSLWICLDFATVAERLTGPLAVLVLVPAAVLLTGATEKGRAAALRLAALMLGALVAGEVGWALPDPAGPATWLHRDALLFLALATMAMLYGDGFALARPRGVNWADLGRRLAPVLSLLAGTALLILLVQEALAYDPMPRRTPMAPAVIGLVVLACGLVLFRALRAAVAPGHDPLGLSARGRTIYVYAAEVLLLLLFIHLRLNVPELFRGWAARYWTLIVMGIAFAGVGLGEWFERRGLRVLAEPLRQTGAFLPLVPLLAFWVRPPEGLSVFAIEPWPATLGGYANLWLLAALLYTGVALTRRSFGFAVLAALAGNGGLWSLLAHHDLTLFIHPQLWLIPPGLLILAAEHTNRDRLRPDLSQALRYFGVLLVYVSSTADLFITGVGNSVVLPVVLALLSVLGVLAGIMLRVRAFMFLGVAFLGLDIFTMIWHAAVNRYHTWVWWVSGIILGAAILALFALFEKRRDDVLQLVDEVRRWD